MPGPYTTITVAEYNQMLARLKELERLREAADVFTATFRKEAESSMSGLCILDLLKRLQEET